MQSFKFLLVVLAILGASLSMGFTLSMNSVLKPFQDGKALKIISGLQNFDADLVEKVSRAAYFGGATHVDIACDPELVKVALKAGNGIPVCVSAIEPEKFVPAVAAGATMVELGNFDSFYESGRTFSAEEVLEMARKTRALLPNIPMAVTVPHTLELSEQAELAVALEAAGADVIQTEGKYNIAPSKGGIQGAMEKAVPTLAAARTLSAAVGVPVLAASGLSEVTAPLALAAGARGVGVGAAVNRLGDEVLMTAVVRGVAASLGLEGRRQAPAAAAPVVPVAFRNQEEVFDCSYF
ncbi:unnamed protein product [Heterosigma akashiwo]|mmetsp:Transcript_7881/g.11017  ORF Transcript_7881/g.11017 Transcript_7881/m.11017 type:complete len:295 (-) Transcript_7881:55-939(-)